MLFLMRHGQAGAHLTDMELDRERHLLPEGREEVYRVAQGLRRLGVAPLQVIASPYTRTQETAEIVAPIIAPGIAITLDERIHEDAVAADVKAAIGHDFEQPCLVVTHADVIHTFSTLVTDKPLWLFEISPAAVLAVDETIDPVPGRPDIAGPFMWLMQASQLGLLADTAPGAIAVGLKPLISASELVRIA